MAATAGRKGRPWRRARSACLNNSTLCHLCRHEGAGEADHHPLPLEALKALGLDPNNPIHLKPAHGSSSPCPTCGKCCNQIKGNRIQTGPAANSRDW